MAMRRVGVRERCRGRFVGGEWVLIVKIGNW